MREIVKSDLRIQSAGSELSAVPPSVEGVIDRLGALRVVCEAWPCDLRYGVRRSCLSAPWARAELDSVLHPPRKAESSATRNG